jgi:tetratricopeptide (TPR) repeat protein
MVNKYAQNYTTELKVDEKGNVSVSNKPAPDTVAKIAMSLGLCQLRLKLYDKALASFERALGDDAMNADLYLYATVCLLHGQKAFMMTRENADTAIQYLNAAAEIDPENALFPFFSAYIKLDYFKRKYFNIEPDYACDLETAFDLGITAEDAGQLFDMLQTEMPDAMKN